MTSNAPTTEETPKSSSSTESTSLENEQTDSSSAEQRGWGKPRKKRENVREKAERILVYGRLRIVEVDGDRIIAECRGDSGEVYKLGHDPRNKQWRCGCPARTACSHLHALWSVTAVER